jgi:hypothetical protein
VKTILIALFATAFAGSAAAAQEKAAPPPDKQQQEMMAAFERMGAVGPEHKQLDYFAGDWKVATTTWMDPKAPPQMSEGKSHSAATLGGRYVEISYDGTMMGKPFTGRGLLGFDNISGRYFNAWIDDMSTGIWLAYGGYDAATQTYTFRGSMDDPMQPKTKVAVRQVVHVVDPTHYMFEWYETRKGKEAKTMQSAYTKL